MSFSLFHYNFSVQSLPPCPDPNCLERCLLGSHLLNSDDVGDQKERSFAVQHPQGLSILIHAMKYRVSPF